ncbi:MAG: DUF4824 family protein [Vicinamibacterales bacterium]|jgi:hypothetical protein|nr:DUF4824 family protein [Vicinamibacterales bacterium]
MRRYGPWLAATLVIVSNLAAWRVAALNRSGEPEAVLVLTERELQLPARQTENTALSLRLVFDRWRERGDTVVREAGWFGRAKLESIGFDCRRPVTAENADDYRTRPPRRTFAALEYGEGASLDSRLSVVDVDNDAAALRRRHPDRRRVAVVEATAAVRYVSNPGQPPFLMGRVTSVLPAEINVPREWRGALEGLQSDAQTGTWPPPQREPRFRATVAWGKRLEPWITNVELLTPQPAR